MKMEEMPDGRIVKFYDICGILWKENHCDGKGKRHKEKKQVVGKTPEQIPFGVYDG